jgi:tRNA(Ile)-lysidine synthase
MPGAIPEASPSSLSDRHKETAMSSENPSRLKETVKWFNLSEELFPKDGLVLAAVSGGPDSVALLSILHTLCRGLKFRLAVGHFDHQIRDSGEKDRSLVESLGKSLGLPVYSGAEDVRERAAASGDTLEEAARKARYQFLTTVADEIKAQRIATGHTKDDQAETVLMRIIHGAGVRGLAGIPTRRGRIIRPLLCLSREETRSYCDELGISYVSDPTNQDTTILRNRIRLELLPLLESTYHHGTTESLLRLAKNAQDMIASIRERTHPLIEQNLRSVSPHEWILNVVRIAPLDDTSIVVIFGDVFSEALGCDMDFGRVHYEQLIHLVRDSRGSGKMLSLPGLTVKREYENLILTKPRASASIMKNLDYRATLTFPGETRAAGVVIKTEIVERSLLDNESIKSTHRVAYFALDRLRLPLVLRTARAGDRMRPFGMEGTKKLSDLFIDKKIPGRERAKAFVVADADEILWVVGVATNEKSRVTSDTGKVIRITLDEE